MTRPPWPAPTPSGEPHYLGILNITPDSFSDGGRFLEPAAALAQAHSLVAQGAEALDVGAESTRPGAAPVTPEAEAARLGPVLALLRSELPMVPVSLDTRHALVAAMGLQAGVAVLNDVTGFQDPAMLELARQGECGVIAMRSRTRDGALVMPPYDGAGPATPEAAVAELAQVRDRLLAAGLHRDRILLDPGFGFGLPFREDLALWEALPELPALLDWPVDRFLLGVSRKRFLAWASGTPDLPAAERDILTARAHRQALDLGYRHFRTHTGPRPQVRAARPADAEALALVQISSWRSAYREVIPGAILDRLAAPPLALAFRTMADGPPPSRLWAMEWAGKLCGYAATGPSREPGLDPERVAEVYAIYSLKETWGLGLGRSLMAWALAALREQGFKQACLWVLERNPRARAFYQAGGWQPSGGTRTVNHDGIALRELQYTIDLTSNAWTTVG